MQPDQCVLRKSSGFRLSALFELYNMLYNCIWIQQQSEELGELGVPKRFQTHYPYLILLYIPDSSCSVTGFIATGSIAPLATGTMNIKMSWMSGRFLIQRHGHFYKHLFKCLFMFVYAFVHIYALQLVCIWLTLYHYLVFLHTVKL